MLYFWEDMYGITAKFIITKIINLRDCALDHRKSACEHLTWHFSSPDHYCTSHHTRHSIHNRTILTPEMIRGWHVIYFKPLEA